MPGLPFEIPINYITRLEPMFNEDTIVHYRIGNNKTNFQVRVTESVLRIEELIAQVNKDMVELPL